MRESSADSPFFPVLVRSAILSVPGHFVSSTSGQIGPAATVMPIAYPKGSEWRRWDLHIHTTASGSDYKYNQPDADQKLIDTLQNNNLCAVAITDHFTISAQKIQNLRSLAPNIIFFPGVEFRTDKGSHNIHVVRAANAASERS